MPFIPTGYGQASINFTGANCPNGSSIVIGFANVGAQDAQACLGDIGAAFGAVVDNMCTSDVALTSLDIKLGPNDVGEQYSQGVGPFAGAVGGTSLSPGSAVIVEKNTGMGGRRGTGRMYWPGVYDAWVDDDGALGSGIAAQIDGFMATLFTDLDTRGVPMFLLHSPSYTWELQNGRPRRVYAALDTAGEPTGVTSLSVDPIIGTQRRRLR